MPDYVDRRILQAVYDGRQFDRNIAKSKKSLEDFKKVMNFDSASRDLNAFASSANNLDFSRLERNLEALANKFTGLGDVSEYIVSRIRSGLEGTAKYVENFMKDLTIGQFKAGQSKYDALTKAVMTITATGKYTEEQAYSVFERLMTYTNETSYSFADMVNQISSFTATGKGLKESERVMEGIANMSAKAGQGVSQASAAMRVFSKAMGAGYLGLQEWNSLNQTSHVITEEFRKTLIETAVATGDLIEKNGQYFIAPKHRSDSANAAAAAQQTAAAAQKAASAEQKALVQVNNLENTLHQKWMTSEVLMQALEKYYFEGIDDPDANWDTFAGSAAKAAQRALSLADALNAMKEAVSAGWMTSYELFWGKLGESMHTFTNIANRAIEILDRITEWRNGVLEVWANDGGRVSFAKILLGDYGQDVQEGVVGFFDLIEKAGDFVARGFSHFFKLFAPKNLQQYWDSEGFQEAWFGTHLKNMTEAVSEFFTGIDAFFNAEVQVGDTTKTRIQMMDEAVMGFAAALKMGYDIVTGILGLFKDIAAQLMPTFDTILAFLSALGLSVNDTVQSVSEAKSIPAFFKTIADALRPVTNAINITVSAIANLLAAIFGLGNQNGTTPTIFQMLGNGIIILATVAGQLGARVINFFTNIVQIIRYLVANRFSRDAIANVFNYIASTLREGFTKAFNAVFNLLPQTVREKITAVVGAVVEFFKSLFAQKEKKPGFFDNLIAWVMASYEKVKAFFSGGVITNVLTWITNTFNRIREFFSNDAIPFAIKKIQEWRQALSGFSAYLSNTFGAKFLAFLNWLKEHLIYIIGIAALVGIGMLISKVVFICTQLAEGFYNITSIMKTGVRLQPPSMEQTGDKWMKIAGAVAILVGSAITLGMLPWQPALQGVLGVVVIMIAMNAMIKSMRKTLKGLSVQEATTMVGALIAMGLAISIIIGALMRLSSMLDSVDSKGNANGGEKLAVMAGGLVVILVAIYEFVKRLDRIGGHAAEVMNSMLVFALGIGVLIFALSKIDPDKIITMFIGLLAILVPLGAFLSALADSKAKSDSIKGITGLVIGIVILLLALTTLKDLKDPVREIGTMALALIAVLLPLAAFIDLVNNRAKAKPDAIKGLAALVISISALIFSLYLLKDLTLDDQLLKMGVSLFVILGLLYAFVLGVSKTAGVDGKGLNGVLALAGGIALLIFALLPLAILPWPMLGKMGAGLGAILLALGAFIWVVGKGSSLKGKGLIALAAVAAGIFLIIVALLPLSLMNWEELKKMGAGLVAVIGMLALLVLATKGANLVGAGVLFLAMLGIVVIMVVLANTLKSIRDMDLGVILAFTLGLAAVILAVAGAIAILSSIPFGAGLKGIVLLSAAIVAIIGVLSLMLPMLISSVGSGLAEAGGKLKLASGLIADFMDRMSGISATDTAKASNVMDIIKIIFEKAKELGSYGSSINSFTTALYDLGSGLAVLGYFADQITDSETTDVVKMIQDLAGTADDLQKLGNVRLTNFVSSLQGLGGALSIYAMGAEEVKDVDESTVDIGKAIGIIEALATGIKEHGGFDIPTNIPSEEELGVFGAQLAALAMAMVKFENAGKQLGDGTAQALSALDFLADIKRKLVDQKIELAAVTGYFEDQGVDDTVLEQFGKNIGALGESLAKFASDTTTFNKDTGKAESLNFEAGLNTLNEFAALQEKLPDNSWLASLISKKETLAEFAGEVENLGMGLSDFYKKAEGLSSTEKQADMAAALTSLTTLSGFMTDLRLELPVVGGLVTDIVNFFSDHPMSIDEFSALISGLGTSLGKFGDSIAGKFLDVENTQNALDTVNGFIELMDSITRVNSWDTWANPRDIADTLDNFVLALTSREYGNAEESLSFMDNMVTLMVGISRKVDELGGVNGTNIAAFRDLAYALTGFSTIQVQKDYEPVGMAIAQGIALGITNGTTIVTKVAANLAIAVYNATMQALNAHSPSRLFADMGAFVIDQGLANGITNGEDTVLSAIRSMSGNTVDTAATLMTEVSRAMAEDTNASPAITPVLDLSQIRSGMASLGQTFSGATLDVGASLAMAGRTGVRAAETNQNGTDFGGIYERMNQMNENILNLASAISDMKLVLDTGEVAGAITRTIDRNLGKQSVYARRRN